MVFVSLSATVHTRRVRNEELRHVPPQNLQQSLQRHKHILTVARHQTGFSPFDSQWCLLRTTDQLFSHLFLHFCSVTASNTNIWIPDFIEIHNDSCSSQVTVRFPPAPKHYSFSYKLRLVSSEGKEVVSDKMTNKNASKFEGTSTLSWTFHNVEDGTYKLQVRSDNLTAFH